MLAFRSTFRSSTITDTVLGFLESTPSGWTRLVEAHVEHRLLLLRVATLALVALFGEVDFRTLAWLGNLGVLTLSVFLFAGFRKDASWGARIVTFSPATWFLFQPQYWDSFFWATASLSNLWVLPMALACFGALGRTGGAAFLLALAAGCVAALTQANGLLVLPIGALLLLRNGRHREAALWIVFSLLLAGAYAAGLQRPEGSVGILESLLRPSVWQYALYFIGAAGGFGSPLPSALVGLAILAIAAWGLPRSTKANPGLAGLLLLVVASGLLNALGREFIAGPDYALGAARYRFYGSAALALAYLVGIETLIRPRARHWAFAVGVSLALAFAVNSYRLDTPRALVNATRLEQGFERWTQQRRGLRHPHPDRASAILEAAIASGIYRPQTSDR